VRAVIAADGGSLAALRGRGQPGGGEPEGCRESHLPVHPFPLSWTSSHDSHRRNRGRRHDRFLVFSDAGGTGRSYHADLGAKNRRLGVHYLLEAGWKADTAIQGLGRSNRTQSGAGTAVRPIATDVKAEKRFLSTIARRLDTLGAITKGQRQTGGQGLFRPEDNLESIYVARRCASFSPTETSCEREIYHHTKCKAEWRERVRPSIVGDRRGRTMPVAAFGIRYALLLHLDGRRSA
jgi:hypothetical protein